MEQAMVEKAQEKIQECRDPFGQGIPRDAVLRLLTNQHTQADRKRYYRCEWWRELRERALEAAGHFCRLCGRRPHLQVHHLPQGYKRMFRETLADLTVVCRHCHKGHHGH